jgi:hypothetical protein
VDAVVANGNNDNNVVAQQSSSGLIGDVQARMNTVNSLVNRYEHAFNDVCREIIVFYFKCFSF